MVHLGPVPGSTGGPGVQWVRDQRRAAASASSCNALAKSPRTLQKTQPLTSCTIVDAMKSAWLEHYSPRTAPPDASRILSATQQIAFDAGSEVHNRTYSNFSFASAAILR